MSESGLLRWSAVGGKRKESEHGRTVLLTNRERKESGFVRCHTDLVEGVREERVHLLPRSLDHHDRLCRTAAAAAAAAAEQHSQRPVARERGLRASPCECQHCARADRRAGTTGEQKGGEQCGGTPSLTAAIPMEITTVAVG